MLFEFELWLQSLRFVLVRVVVRYGGSLGVSKS
jgi:hypothetical protein